MVDVLLINVSETFLLELISGNELFYITEL